MLKAFGFEISTEGIERLIGEAVAENLHWEFKRFINDTAIPSSQDRDRLAKIVSGFANSRGGVLVWGGRTNKMKGGAEFLEGYDGIKGFREFAQHLDSLMHNIVDPVPPGVQNIPIQLPGTDVGVVVTLVPEYDGLPVMARASKEQYCFFQRNGSSFNKMESYQLADRFGRRPHPQLVSTFKMVDGRYKSHPNDPNMSFYGAISCSVTLDIFVDNVGRGIARDVAIKLLISNESNMMFEPQISESKIFKFNGESKFAVPLTNLSEDFKFYPGTQKISRVKFALVPKFFTEGQLFDFTIVLFAEGWTGTDTHRFLATDHKDQFYEFAKKHWGESIR